MYEIINVLVMTSITAETTSGIRSVVGGVADRITGQVHLIESISAIHQLLGSEC